MSIYTEGLELVFNLQSLLLIAVGVTLGMLFGAIPGLTANMGVALFVPVTYAMSPEEALILLIGIYLGSLYGGTIPAVLLNIPGTPADLMTGLDGYPMTRRGEGGRAIGIGVCASFLGGLGSAFVLATVAPLLADLAGSFGSQEYFALAVLGIIVVGFVASESMAKALASALFGLFIATVGTDLITGQQRFTFGQAELLAGIGFIPIIIGLFGLGEVLEQLHRRGHRSSNTASVSGRVLPGLGVLNRLKWTIARSSLTGVLIGALPGAGATLASVVAYGQQKRLSKEPEKMGRGAPEGVAASDAANNACTGGALTTMLSLGIPGDSVTAILIGAMVLHGVQPGPQVFDANPQLVSAIFISLVVANFCLLLVGLAGAKFFAKIVSVPKNILLPTIAVLCVIGGYAIQNTSFGIVVMLISGIIGFLFAKGGVPKPPLILGLILGPIMEQNFRRSLAVSDGELGSVLQSFLSSPIAMAILVACVFLLSAPIVRKIRGRNVAR